MLALAWLFAIVGLVATWVVGLAGAMKTVPRLEWREAIVGLPLPLLAIGLAAWCLYRPIRPGDPRTERPWIAAGIPLALALLALLILAVSYFDQPAGPM